MRASRPGSALALLLCSCGAAPEVGDWFRCADAECAAVGDDGVRLLDGRFTALTAAGSTLTEDELYCEETAPSKRGAYHYRDLELEMIPEQGPPETVRFEVQDRSAMVEARGQAQRWLWIEPRSSGSCAPNRLR
jgi:hypothetical protein